MKPRLRHHQERVIEGADSKLLRSRDRCHELFSFAKGNTLGFILTVTCAGIKAGAQAPGKPPSSPK